MILPFLLKIFLSRKAKTHLVKVALGIFLFISAILLLFLALSCLRPSASLSDVYLLETRSSNSTVIRTGYFHMCSRPQPSAAFSCASLGGFKHDGSLAYTFAKHVSRPYFLALSLAMTMVALAFVVARLFVRQVGDFFLPWLILTFIFTMVTAVWQQVAVHAAVRIGPADIRQGNRAGAMVWTAFAFTSLSLLLELFIPESREDVEIDDAESKEGEHSIMSTIYKVGDGISGL